MTKPTISCELFPPLNDAAKAKFWPEIEKLAQLKPLFFSVTDGAAGRAVTVETALNVRARTNIATAAHLTAIGTLKPDLPALVARLWEGGVRHVIALRGSPPQDPSALAELLSSDCYQYANELMAGLRAQKSFELSVGCYPEASTPADFDALKMKIDAGATRAITQFFFDNDIYFNFVEKARAAGITIPIAAGVLPILDLKQMLAFAKTCRASVPDALHEKFSTAQPIDLHSIAAEVLAEQCRGLAAGGAPHIHFYTLNRADLTQHACTTAQLAG